MNMTQRLYRRIYKYLALSVLIAIIFTGLTMSLFRPDHRAEIHTHFFTERLEIMLYVAQRIYSTAESQPDLIQQQLNEVAQDLDWQINYWPKAEQANGSADSTALFERLQVKPQEVVLALDKSPPQALAYLHPSNKSAGLVYIRFPQDYLMLPQAKGQRPPPKGRFPKHHLQSKEHTPMRTGRPPRPPSHWIPTAIALTFLLLALAILLLPLVRSLGRPMRELFESIEKVSEGDFSRPLVLERESEFTPVAEAFNHMIIRVQAMLSEKQRLIADVSHELRSPLGRMRVSLELLSKEGKGKAKYIERAIREVEELDHLISDLLDISALELDAERAPLESINLNDWVQNAIEIHQLVFDERGFEVQSHLPAQNIQIQGRRHLLDRALNNLFSNAIKYAPENTTLDITVFSENDSVGVEVRDRGPGLPPEELEKILQPFYRPDVSRTRKTGGNGLGLAIVDKIMRLHKGQIAFRLPDDDEGGLIARLSWPLTNTSASKPGAKTGLLKPTQA